jgi:xanthine/uracil permease
MNRPLEGKMKLQYGLDDKPPLMKSCLIGLQWAAILICSTIILGKVVGTLHFQEPLSQILYLQKILFICALTLFCQIFWGHRLPLLPGPAAVLFVGVIASQGFALNTIYTSIMIGGLFITFLGASGLLKYLRRFFTPNVIAVVLLLIAFTISPTIQNLIVDSKSGVGPLSNLGFALALVFVMLFCYRFLRGIWQSTLIIWAVIAGSLIYLLIFPDPGSRGLHADIPWCRDFFRQMNIQFSIAPGLLISFLFCYIALAINDLGSIQAVNEMLHVDDMDGRITRGIFTTGLANTAAGLLGVIGPVDYSVSPGVIAATRCASRFTLIPAAGVMFLMAFSPAATGFIGNVPSVVIGAILAYVMMIQVGAGLMVAFEREKDFRFEDGLVIGVSILIGTLIAFLPGEVFGSLSPFLRPILGNGFVIGVISALIMEQLLRIREK